MITRCSCQRVLIGVILEVSVLANGVHLGVILDVFVKIVLLDVIFDVLVIGVLLAVTNNALRIIVFTDVLAIEVQVDTQNRIRRCPYHRCSQPGGPG